MTVAFLTFIHTNRDRNVNKRADRISKRQSIIDLVFSSVRYWSSVTTDVVNHSSIHGNSVLCDLVFKTHVT